jgi:glycosyltransferase involved in cell wall biosynthesis
MTTAIRFRCGKSGATFRNGNEYSRVARREATGYTGYRRSSMEEPTSAEPANDDERPPVCPLCGASAVDFPEPGPELIRRWLGEGAARRLGFFPLPPGLRLSIVIPIYNEKETVGELVRRVRAVPLPKELILVDDGSTDGTREVLARLEAEEQPPDADPLKVFYHERNQGKGAALRTGFGHVSGDIVIVQDADLEYDPNQYPQLIQPIVEGLADVVFGSRFLAGNPHRVLYYWHYVANRLLTTLSNMFTDLNLTDMETCYKVFRREVIEAILPMLKQNRFGIEPEITAKVARGKWRIFEIGISYAGRTYEEGKKIGLRDALHALWCVVRYWRWD